MQVFKIASPMADEIEIQPAHITSELIQAYLGELADMGRSRATVQVYASKLRAFYDFLPPDKSVAPKTLLVWREALLTQGYSLGTINTHLSAANGLLAYLGRRDLQLIGQLSAAVPNAQPQLTRTEYLRLLQAAHILGRERIYLIMKVIALTGIRVGELPLVTAEAVRDGQLMTASGGETRCVPFPGCLQRELMDYLSRHGIHTGAVFITRRGLLMQRTQVTQEIQSLSRDAQVEKSKCTPRCLQKLYQDTLARISENIRQLAEQSYEKMLDLEQLVVGWDENEPFPTANYESVKRKGDRE